MIMVRTQVMLCRFFVSQRPKQIALPPRRASTSREDRGVIEPLDEPQTGGDPI